MKLHLATLAAVMLLGVPMAVAQTSQPTGEDEMLTRARKYVESSDRYLHHGQLKRGMTGYGLTVMEGTKIVRFDVKIVSVMKHWGPHQDVIWATLSTHDLEKTGIIAGMSGSPVFITGADGKDRIIGAVAYGFKFQKDPLCGIQPITQMIAASGILEKGKGTTQPTQPANIARAGGGSAELPVAPEAYLKAVLDPHKTDFIKLLAPKGDRVPEASDDAMAPRLMPVATPLMVSGIHSRSMAHLAATLRPMGIVPVQSGGVGVADLADVGEVKLEPGSAVAVPLVTGDADLSAVGTVTDVINGRVLAFGHSFNGQGSVCLPMGPAYVHTVISSLSSSFKMASPLGVTGCLNGDEQVGVYGDIGGKSSMVPMTINVDWKDDGRKQTYRYKLAHDRLISPVMARYMIADATSGWHNLPEHHTVRYSAVVDFGALGKYKASNVTSDADVSAVASDVLRPMVAMLVNPLGEAPPIEAIEVNITIEPESTVAAVLDLKLDGTVYKPGDAVRGTLTLMPYRQKRTSVPVEFKLPADLKEGRYTLSACDALAASQATQREMPQRFAPRTVKQLLDTLQTVVEAKGDRLYLRLNTQKGGLAIGVNELPDLPPSKAAVLAEAANLDARPFSSSLVQSVQMQYVLEGSAQAEIEVQATPRATPVRQAQ